MNFSILKKIFKKKKAITPAPEPTSVAPKKSKDLDEIIRYINKRYSDSSLKVYQVSAHLQVPQPVISAYLKKKHGMSFRQYLNHIRIEKAKILLQQKELSISAIAFKVGYGNIQHFNRIFKEHTGHSPGQLKDGKL